MARQVKTLFQIPLPPLSPVEIIENILVLHLASMIIFFLLPPRNLSKTKEVEG